MLSTAIEARGLPAALLAPRVRQQFDIRDELGVLADVRLRPITDDDLPFLCQVYSSARAAELSAITWSDEEKAAFLRQQFAGQHRYYREHYADSQFMVILRRGQSIGRLYWRDNGVDASLLDISLLPESRGGGIGSAILSRLLERADQVCQSITLHVEPDSPARRLYCRNGFEVLANNGVYLKMRRPPRGRRP